MASVCISVWVAEGVCVGVSVEATCSRRKSKGKSVYGIRERVTLMIYNVSELTADCVSLLLTCSTRESKGK